MTRVNLDRLKHTGDPDGAILDGEQLYYIKANIPGSAEAAEDGNGEGCFFLVDAAAKAAHDNDAEGDGYTGILDNDSSYYPGLEYGEVLPLRMMGDKRPVVPYEALSRWVRSMRPCPLCGNDAPQITGDDATGWGVLCSFCNCSIQGYESEAAAVRRWNARA